MSQQKDNQKQNEAYAYTPGLKIKNAMIVRKTRILPLPGEILVKKGDKVDFDTIVARTEAPGEPFILEATNIMGMHPGELPRYMVKKEGDRVVKDEPVAQWITLFGLIKRIARSPADGIVESFSDLTGRITVREDPTKIEMKAYIPGEVVNIIPQEGVIIETNAAFIQGILGIGGERHGQLVVAVKSPDEPLKSDIINSKHEGKIIIGGSFITTEALRKAVDEKVAGIVVGGINAFDLTEFLGYKLGIAITGHEEIMTSLVVTEGFGKMNMSLKTFELLKSFQGEEAAINGTTQIRAGVMRPEVIIPIKMVETETITDDLTTGLNPGALVRVIRTPYFGRIGVVKKLPIELQKLETGSYARILIVELENGEQVMVPRANVEIIEG